MPASVALKAMAASGHKELPAAWAEPVASSLNAYSGLLADSFALLKAVPPVAERLRVRPLPETPSASGMPATPAAETAPAE